MAYSADVLASTLQELLPDYVDTFTFNHPLWDRIKKGGKFNRRKLKGPFVDFVVVTGGPGYVTADRTGSTLLAGGRKEKAKKGTAYPTRLIYHFDVPEKDLEEVQVEHDFVNLVSNYGDPAMADLSERMARQVSRGDSSSGSGDPGVDGFFTLNGDQAYYPQDVADAEQGLFDFRTIANQANTVHGLPMSGAGTSPTVGWEHQYAEISSFEAEGRKVLRSTRDKAMQQGASLEGYMDLLISDDASYQNYLEDLDDAVITPVVDQDKGKHKVREGVKFGMADWFSDPAIDISDTTSFTTAAAQQGVVYGMTTADFELIMLGSKGGSGGDIFRVQDPIRLPDQPMVHYRVVTYSNVFCRNLRRQMVVLGGANP